MHFKKCINTILKRSYGGREDISLVVQGVVRIFCSFTWYMWPKDWLMLTLHTLFKESSRQDIKQAKATQTRYKAYRNERENERERVLGGRTPLLFWATAGKVTAAKTSVPQGRGWSVVGGLQKKMSLMVVKSHGTSSDTSHRFFSFFLSLFRRPENGLLLCSLVFLSNHWKHWYIRS